VVTDADDDDDDDDDDVAVNPGSHNATTRVTTGLSKIKFQGLMPFSSSEAELAEELKKTSAS